MNLLGVSSLVVHCYMIGWDHLQNIQSHSSNTPAAPLAYFLVVREHILPEKRISMEATLNMNMENMERHCKTEMNLNSNHESQHHPAALEKLNEVCDHKLSFSNSAF